MVKKRKLVAKNKRFTRRRILLLVLVAFILIGAGIGLFTLLQKNDSASTATLLPFSTASSYAYTGSGFLYTSSEKLCYMDLSDEKNNYEMSLGTSEVSVIATKTLAALYNSAAVHIVGAEYPVEFSGQVIAVRCGTEHIAVLRQDNAGTLALQVFDSNAAKMGQIDTGSTQLVNFGFDSTTGTEILWTLTMDTSGQSPISTITTYKYNESNISTTGIMTIQAELVEDVKFSGKSIFAICTNNIFRYDMTSNAEVYRTLIYGSKLLDVSFGASKPLFILVSRDDVTLSTVKLVSLSEEEISNESSAFVQLPTDSIDAFAMGGKLVAFTKDRLCIYNSSEHIWTQTKLDITVDSVAKLSEKRVVLTSGSKLYMMTVK